MRDGCLARKGSINGISVNSQNQDARELLVVPNTELVISNTHKEEKLLLLSVYPFCPPLRSEVESAAQDSRALIMLSKEAV